MPTFNENEQDKKATDKKKISLEEAIKQKLTDKKKGQLNNKSAKNNYMSTTKHMKSQQSKKANNQHRRTGV